MIQHNVGSTSIGLTPSQLGILGIAVCAAAAKLGSSAMGCSPMSLCGSTGSEQKADNNGGGVVLSVVGMVDKQ